MAENNARCAVEPSENMNVKENEIDADLSAVNKDTKLSETDEKPVIVTTTATTTETTITTTQSTDSKSETIVKDPIEIKIETKDDAEHSRSLDGTDVNSKNDAKPLEIQIDDTEEELSNEFNGKSSELSKDLSDDVKPSIKEFDVANEEKPNDARKSEEKIRIKDEETRNETEVEICTIKLKTNDDIHVTKSSNDSSSIKTDSIDNRRESEEVITVNDRSNESVEEILCDEEVKLKEILKIVHDDLDIETLKKSTRKRNRSECDANAKEKNDEDVVEDSVAEVVPDTVKTEDERPEVGIVGPPTALCELIDEEELRAESAPSSDEKPRDHVAEWLRNSSKVGESAVAEGDGESENTRRDDRPRRRNLKRRRTRRKKDLNASSRKSRSIVVGKIVKRSIKWLNKMHAMDSAGGNGKKVDAAEKTREEETSRASPKVPQSQQNGAALPEETAAASAVVAATNVVDHPRPMVIKKEPNCEPETQLATKSHSTTESSAQKANATAATATTRSVKTDPESGRKRKSTDGQFSSNGNSAPKKLCLEQRERYISSLVGCEKVTAEELATRADQLRAEVQALDELARAKEMEWNEILSMRKLKEEAYLRIERRRQVMGFMEGNGQLAEGLPPASLALTTEWESSGNTTPVSKEKCGFESKEDFQDENSEDAVAAPPPPSSKRDKGTRPTSQRHSTSPPKQNVGGSGGSSGTGENGRKQRSEASSPENRQIGEGRQGAIVDVRSIIADYRLRHPETVPRRGRRMRNSVNVGLGAGGAMVETGHNVDSRPSSTDSCKSNPNATDSTNSMSFKDVLVQFAKLSQQQGEPVKTPQNYPDVTLHPVAPSAAPQNATPPQQTGSLLHGILTKSQSPRPTTFSPTLARLLTAPERERNAPTATSASQQTATTQHLLQAYQGSNPVSISDLLSSSKTRTEITITPVVNTPVQSHSNSLIHVDDVEEETAVIEDRETRVSSGGRDNRDDRDSPPRCQGCHERAAQFVCAGCGNQWYCSRECQVAAWDEHSEVCSG